jgi:hypothetical protein
LEEKEITWQWLMSAFTLLVYCWLLRLAATLGPVVQNKFLSPTWR